MKFGGEASKPFDPVGSLARHWKKVLLAGIITFVALLPLVKMKSKTHFEAEGKIRIEPVITTTLVGAKNSIVDQYGGYVGTEIFKIHHPETVKVALKKLPDNLRTVFLKPELSRKRALDILMKGIKVEKIRDTHLVKIILLGEKPEGLAELINGIIDTYLDKRRDEAVGKDGERLDYLEGEEKSLAESIAKLTAEIRAIAEKAGMSTFSEQFNPLNRQLGDLQEAFTRAYGSRVAKENAFAAVREEITKLKAIPLDAQIDEMVEKDQSLWNTSATTYDKLQELNASLDGLSAGNPERKAVEKRMKEMKSQLAQLRKAVRERITKVVYAKRDAELKRKLILAESEYKAAQKTEAELREELRRTRKKAAEVSRLILLGQEKEKELKRLNESHAAISGRMRKLQADSRAPGRVSLESYAQVPHEPASSNLKKLLAAAFLFSFGWITVVCFLFDILDSRIRSSKDLETALGFPPVWPVSHLLSGNFARTTLDHTDSVPDKAIHSLAVRLDNEKRKRQEGAEQEKKADYKTKFAVFTSIDSQSGVTELVLNTAHAMRGICRKVLVLELNLATPKLEETLNIPSGALGLAGFLAGKPFTKCAFHEKERGIYVLHINGTISVQNSAIHALLEAVSKSFDFVFIDTAPVLKSDFTEFLIGLANTGVLVIHGDRSLYQNVRHAAEILSRLELPALATVLNWKRYY